MSKLLLGLVAVLVVHTTHARAADAFTPPPGWVVVPPPDGFRLLCANASRLEWTVAMRNGTVAIEAGPARRDALPSALVGAAGLPRTIQGFHVLPVEGGYLVGGGAGEFGGGLTWFSADGKRSSVLHRASVVALLPLQHGAVLSFEGLNHILTRDGTARWLASRSGAWSTSRTVELPEGPEAVAPGDGEAYVLGPEYLTLVSFDGGVRKLQSLPLTLLYPNSMVREDGGALWIGARQFVLRLVPQGAGQPFAVTWLVPAGCEEATRRGHECVCAK